MKLASPTVAAVAMAGALAQPSITHAEAAMDEPALSKKQWRKFEVTDVEKRTRDTSLIRVKFDSPEQRSGLDVASCLLVKARINGKNVIRPYTPVSLDNERGMMELVVKGYPNGNVSKHLVNLKPGDKIDMKGPFPKYQYKPSEKNHIGMIAGGSGITPMIQSIKTILRNPEDSTKITLLFANNSEQDIIEHAELRALTYLYPEKFNVVYVVSHPSADWEGPKGFISKDLLQKHLPPPSEDNVIFVCGPPPMMFAISGDKAKDKSQGELQGMLKEMNYTSSMVYKF